MSVIIKLISKFDDSGIRKAKSGFSSIKAGLTAFAASQGVQALEDIARYMVDAAKAAEEDKKSTELLNDQLVKNAHATKGQIKQNDKFIDSLSTQVGIIDDNLRPAQAKLARATGSVSSSQKLLRLALDASKVSGKSLDSTATALSKAFNGNTTSLIRMFPELKKSKDVLADLNKEVSGAAQQQASPFDKLNVALDNLKEKLGYLILPFIEDMINKFIAPGGLMDVINQFFADIANPNTEIHKTFQDTAQGFKDIFKALQDVLALFGNGDSLKGFENILGVVMKISSFMQSIYTTGLKIAALNPAPQWVQRLYNGISNIHIPGLPQMAEGGIVQPRPGGTHVVVGEAGYPEAIVPLNGRFMGGGGNVINISVHSADPKAVVDAVSKYVKTNGAVPSNWNGYGGKR